MRQFCFLKNTGSNSQRNGDVFIHVILVYRDLLIKIVAIRRVKTVVSFHYFS